jgi:uracil-DNA glycosylase
MEVARSNNAGPAPLDALLADIRACTLCAKHLPLGPRPVVQAGRTARLLIVGQAPGRKVHATGLPFNDASGERLRAWMGISRETFYDERQVAIVPMGFCYPGTGKSGDLPPRPECAPAWRAPLLAQLECLQLTLVIGQYAVAYHLPEARGSLTDTVAGWRRQRPDLLALPHPSPRNNGWLQHNPWFEAELVPALRGRVAAVLAGGATGPGG